MFNILLYCMVDRNVWIAINYIRIILGSVNRGSGTGLLFNLSVQGHIDTFKSCKRGVVDLGSVGE